MIDFIKKDGKTLVVWKGSIPEIAHDLIGMINESYDAIEAKGSKEDCDLLKGVIRGNLGDFLTLPKEKRTKERERHCFIKSLVKTVSDKAKVLGEGDMLEELMDKLMDDSKLMSAEEVRDELDDIIGDKSSDTTIRALDEEV